VNVSKSLSLLLATALLVAAWAIPASARHPSAASPADIPQSIASQTTQEVLSLSHLAVYAASAGAVSLTLQGNSADADQTGVDIPSALSMQARVAGIAGESRIYQPESPDIGVSPASISATQYGGEVTTHLLTISNGGPDALDFTLYEIPGSSPAGDTWGSATQTTSGLGAGVADFGPADPPPTIRVEGPLTVDPQVEAQLDDEPTADFFIWLRTRADLGPAYEIANKGARRTYVYQALSVTASRTQAEIRAYLDRRGLRYEPLWINNAILVYDGDQAVIEAMRARDDVLRIRGVYTQMSIPDPEQVAIVTLDSNQPDADTTWNIDIVNAPQVWSELGITGAGVVVANIDTGVRYTHEALSPSYRGNLGGGSYEHNYNWAALSPDARRSEQCGAEFDSTIEPCDSHGHGSHTMGTMIGGDGNGPFDMDVGMAPDARWMACMGCDGYYPGGPGGCSDIALTACAEWVVAPTDLNGDNPDPTMAPDVVNNSWGGGGEDAWYYSYVEAWNAANIIPVFSAGNWGPGCQTLGSPGSYDAVLGVGGTDINDYNYTASSRGPGSGTGVFAVQKPDVSAPGESVPSAYRFSDSSYTTLSGTSMAAPHVSGLVALMRQVEDSISREEIWEILTGTAATELSIKNGSWCGAGPDFPNYVFGYGRIDALAAVQKLVQGADVPWVGESPSAGTVPAGGSLGVTVTFTAPLDAHGTYAATLRVASNDPASPTIDVPLIMNVLDPSPVLSLTKDAAAPAEAGSVLTYTLVVHNAGGPAHTMTVSDTLPADTLFAWADGGGEKTGEEVRWRELTLPPGDEMSLSFAVTVTCVPSGTEIANVDYRALADGMAAPVSGPPLAVTARQPNVIAGFTFPQPVVRDHPLSFTNTSQNATAYRWDLGDGTTSTAPAPAHAYAQTGAHTVVLTATSPCQTDIYSQELEVHDYALILAPAAAAESAEPGRSVTYTLQLTNTGTLDDSFSLFLDGDLWPTALREGAVGPLSPGASATAEVYVTVPAEAMEGEDDTVTLLVTSMGDPRSSPAHETSTLTTSAAAVYGLELAPPAVEAAGLPGTVLTYSLSLVNSGNAPDEFDLGWAGNLWEVQMPLTHVALAAGADAELPVRVTIPPGAAEGDHDVAVISAVSQGDPAAHASSTLTTTAVIDCLPLSGPELAFSPSTPRVGETVTFTATVAAGSQPISYTWDFGNGGIAGGPLMAHTFSLPGTYTVTVVLSNACTMGVTVERAITVGPACRSYLPLLFGHARAEHSAPGSPSLPGYSRSGRASRR
jgi:uncharacterized repeat protein (TIGR01451 family)